MSFVKIGTECPTVINWIDRNWDRMFYFSSYLCGEEEWESSQYMFNK
jgi:hypothetical protein